MQKNVKFTFFNFSIPQLDPVTNEIIETNEQVVINHRQAEHHPVIFHFSFLGSSQFHAET